MTKLDDERPVTQLLKQWTSGDTTAGEELFPLVYDQLRAIATARLWQERSDHTLQPTALVHETFMKLCSQNRVVWQCREQFLGYSANVMRQVLVDHARTRNRQKRGQGWQKVPMTDVAEIAQTPDGMLALDAALRWLEERDPAMSRMVELRFFGGLTHSEVGQLMEMSETTVRRRWRTARAWLHQQLTQETGCA